MKKMSLLSVFTEARKKSQDLEDWSASLEERPVDIAMQKGATKAMPKDVQAVWGGPALDDQDINDKNYWAFRREDAEEMPDGSMIMPGAQPDPLGFINAQRNLMSMYNLTPQDMQEIESGNYDNIISKVGDVENFALDLGNVYNKNPKYAGTNAGHVSVANGINAALERKYPRQQPQKLPPGSLTLSNALKGSEAQFAAQQQQRASQPSKSVPMAFDKTQHQNSLASKDVPMTYHDTQSMQPPQAPQPPQNTPPPAPVPSGPKTSPGKKLPRSR